MKYSRIILCLLICLPVHLKAQNNINLDEIVVSSTRIPLEIIKSGRHIEVLSNDYLIQHSDKSLDEILQSVVGVNINSRNNFGVQADIGIRGSTFSQVLVLVDNIRFNDPLTGHFNSNFPIALSAIDHIEIIKGPAAVSYGSDAVGGVIHIKTKAFVRGINQEELEVVGQFGIGDHHLRNTDLAILSQGKKYKLSASYKTIASDGETHVNPNFAAGISMDSLYDNYFSTNTFSTAFQYALKPQLSISGRVAYDIRDFNAKYFYTNSIYDESTENISSLWSQATLIYQNNKHNFEFNVAHKSVKDNFIFNPLFTANSHHTIQDVGIINYVTKINSSHRLGLGVEILSKNIESNDRGNHDNTSMSGYALWSLTLGEKAHINLGSRIAYDQNFGVEVLPQVSFSYNLNKIVIRSSFGKSIRAAEFTERYVSNNIVNLAPGRNVGNPDLKAERSFSGDLGFDFYMPHNSKISSSVFFRKSNNLIDFSKTNSNDIHNITNLQEGEEYFYASNISENISYGLELSMQKSRYKIVNSELNTTLNYTYLKTDIETGKLSKYISNHPKHNISFIQEIGYKNYSLQYSSQFITRQSSEDKTINGLVKEHYFISNLKATVSVKNELDFYIKATNFMDIQYQEILGSRLPGRWLSLGVKWAVKK